MKRAAVLFASVAVPLAAMGCHPSSENDMPADAGLPDPLGTGYRIKEIADPTQPNHASFVNANDLTVTGATFLWVDTFDETADGKSKGDVYFQDVGSNAPYSGINAYEETYEPADLKPQPGDCSTSPGSTRRRRRSAGRSSRRPPCSCSSRSRS